MKNAKHIGYLWASAVALGVGLAVANTPGVASAAPADSGKGSAGESSASSSPGQPGSASSDSPSESQDSALSANDAPSGQRRSAVTTAALTPSTSISATGGSGTRAAPATRGVAERKRGGAGEDTGPVEPGVSSFAASTQSAASTAAAPRSSTAAAPVQPPAEHTAVDPGFISSTKNFGLFSVTSAGDPDDNNFVAVVLTTPLFINILTSGADPEDNLGFGAASTGIAGNTVNTFLSPFLNFSLAIPVEDPFAELFIRLIRLGIV